MAKYVKNKAMNKLVKRRTNKKMKRRENNKSKQINNTLKQHKHIKVYRFHPTKFINHLLQNLNIINDYELLIILNKIIETNEEAYIQRKPQSEIVIIKKDELLESDSIIYAILINFTILDTLKIGQLPNFLREEISKTLIDKKKYIFFLCSVNKKHSFNRDINKVLNTEQKFYYNLKKIYNKIFSPSDMDSLYVLENLLFDGVKPPSKYMISFEN
jgi:hypothetical protein